MDDVSLRNIRIDDSVAVVFSEGMRKFRFALILLILVTFPARAELRCVESEAFIEITNGDLLVLRYNKVPTEEADKNDPVYSRSGYIHPLCTPSGKVVTGDYAPDHPHQHGLFFAWTKTIFEGRNPEFWNQKLASGRVGYLRTNSIISQPEESGFEVEQVFEDLTAEGGAKPVLKETWRVLVSLSENGYLVDLESRQHCAGSSPLTIEKYHYGGMALRGNGEWLGEDDKLFLTSDGFGRVEGNHTRPSWVKMAGSIDDVPCGIVSIGHPENFRSPQWVRLHPAKPYFVFAPMVEEPFVIAPGEEYLSRYRFLVFDGELSEDKINEIAESYR